MAAPRARKLEQQAQDQPGGFLVGQDHIIAAALRPRLQRHRQGVPAGALGQAITAPRRRGRRVQGRVQAVAQLEVVAAWGFPRGDGRGQAGAWRRRHQDGYPAHLSISSHG